MRDGLKNLTSFVGLIFVTMMSTSVVLANPVEDKFGDETISVCLQNYAKGNNSQFGFALVGLSMEAQCAEINQYVLTADLSFDTTGFWSYVQSELQRERREMLVAAGLWVEPAAPAPVLAAEVCEPVIGETVTVVVALVTETPTGNYRFKTTMELPKGAPLPEGTISVDGVPVPNDATHSSAN